MRVAIREGPLGGLDSQVDPSEIGPSRRSSIVGLEDARRGRLERAQHVEDLQGDDPGGVRRMRGRDRIAVGHGKRGLPRGVVVCQVGPRDLAAGGREAGGLALGQLARVEIVRSRGGQPRERRRERRKEDPLAGSPRSIVGPVDGGPAAGARPDGLGEERGRPLDRADEVLVGREAALGELDGRGQEVPPRKPPVPGVGVAPRADGPGDRDGQRPTKGEGGQSGRAQRGRDPQPPRPAPSR